MPKPRRIADNAPTTTKAEPAVPVRAGMSAPGSAAATARPAPAPTKPKPVSLAALTDRSRFERAFDLTCPKCRHKFETEPMIRPGADVVIVCPSPVPPPNGCEHFGSFESFVNPGPEPEATTIGDFIECNAQVDRAKEGEQPRIERCGRRYQNRIRGTGPTKGQTKIGGQFVGCPACGAIDRTVPVAAHDIVESQEQDWDAHQLPQASGRGR